MAEMVVTSEVLTEEPTEPQKEMSTGLPLGLLAEVSVGASAEKPVMLWQVGAVVVSCHWGHGRVEQHDRLEVSKRSGTPLLGRNLRRSVILVGDVRL